MKSSTCSVRIFSGLALAAALFVSPPLRALDDTMSQPPHAAKAVEFSFLAAGQIRAADILPPPPGAEAERTAAMETTRAVYHAASEADKNAAYAEKKFSVFNFSEAAGNYLVETNLPKTAAFFQKVQKDAEAVTDEGKDFFQEPRPYTADPSLANGKLEKSFAYPSGHSTEATTLALVLAELLPEKRDAILAHSDLMGWHRVQIARHYPADIYAGRELARAIVHELKKSEAFQKELAEVKAELDAARAMAKN
jgi:acid phosphatase (class A)